VSHKVTQSVYEISVLDRRVTIPSDYPEIPLLQLVVEHNDDGSVGDFELTALPDWGSVADGVARNDALSLEQVSANDLRMMSGALAEAASLMAELGEDEEAPTT
jgi:hypothetical protein